MVDVSVQEIVEAMQAHGGELLGDGSFRVARIAALEHATADSISFLSNPRFADLLESTPAACLIVAPAMREAASKPGRACIARQRPQRVAARCQRQRVQRPGQRVQLRLGPASRVEGQQPRAGRQPQPLRRAQAVMDRKAGAQERHANPRPGSCGHWVPGAVSTSAARPGSKHS